MDDSTFGQNFTWYEWGFVSPSEVPSEDLTVPAATTIWRSPTDDRSDWWDTAYGRPEEHRWPT